MLLGKTKTMDTKMVKTPKNAKCDTIDAESFKKFENRINKIQRDLGYLKASQKRNNREQNQICTSKP